MSLKEDDEERTADESTQLLGDIRDLNAAVEEDPEMERRYANLQHQMSLIRPLDALRPVSHHSHPSIRPSLFGALEVYPYNFSINLVSRVIV
jgi:hypothetical protein